MSLPIKKKKRRKKAPSEPQVTGEEKQDNSDDNEEFEADDLPYVTADKYVLRDIDDYNLLDRETERELLIRAKADPPDQEALRILVQCNKKICAKFAFLYDGRGCDFADLMQEAVLGLLIAIKNYNFKFNYKLSTYAYFCIRTAVQRAVLYKGKMIRINPKEKKDNPKRKVFDAIEHFYSSKGQETLLEEGVFDCSQGQREKFKPFNLDYAPLHESLGTDPESMTLEDKIPSGSTPVEYVAEVNEDFEYLNEVIDSCLEPQERDFIRKRWGLADNITRTKQEMANIYRITPEQAEAREQELAQKLYRNMDTSRLNGDYVDQRTNKKIADLKGTDAYQNKPEE